jgi:hypothetical protein
MVEMIVAAVAAGAAAGLKPTAEQAIKDAYAAVKSLLKRRYDVSVEGLEKNPDSDMRQGVVREDLEAAAAADQPELRPDSDTELIQLVQRLVETVQNSAGDQGDIDLQGIKAALNVRIADIRSAGSLRVKDVEARGGSVDISNLESGSHRPGT